MDFLIEFWQFLRVRKKFWLLPIMLLLLIFGGLLVILAACLRPYFPGNIGKLKRWTQKRYNSALAQPSSTDNIEGRVGLGR